MKSPYKSINDSANSDKDPSLTFDGWKVGYLWSEGV